jgi:hypothetical protein
MSDDNTTAAEIDLSTLAGKLADTTSIFEMLELTGLAQTAVAQRTGDVKAAVTDGASCVAKAVHDAQCAIEKAVSEGAGCVAKATCEVKDATDGLTREVGKLPQPLTEIAESLCQLVVEVRNHKECVDVDLGRICDVMRPICDRMLSDVTIREYEFFKIAALENANEVRRAQLDLLGKTVEAAIKDEMLAEFLEHIEHWKGPISSRARQRKNVLRRA